MEERAKQIAELLKVLANENRLMIFCTLMESPKTVKKIAEKVPNVTQSALSQHLSLLKAHGILHSEKNGQTITYSVADERVVGVIQALRKYYCDTKGEDE